MNGLSPMEAKVERNQPLKYVHRQNLTVQNKNLQEYYMCVYSKKWP